MESSMTNDMHLGIEETDSCHPSGVPMESTVCGQQELHNLLNVLHPYGIAQNPVGVTDIKQVDSSPALTNTIIAGPCSVESEEQIVSTAQALAQIPEVKMLRGGIWKPRTRPDAFEGRGEQGLVWLREAKHATGLPIATEVATPEHVELALKYEVDVLWIGARTVVNPFSVQQLADALKGVAS